MKTGLSKCTIALVYYQFSSIVISAELLMHQSVLKFINKLLCVG